MSVLLRLLRDALRKLSHNDPLRMAGATAFFTSFALPFILIILLQLLGLFVDGRTLRSKLFTDLSDIFGVQGTGQVVNTLIAFRQLAGGFAATLIGSVFLLLVSSTLLSVMRSSINQLWRIRIKHRQGLLKPLSGRLRSLAFIVLTGVLFGLSLLTDALKVFTTNRLSNVSPTLASCFMGIATYLFSLLFITLWFGMLFRWLPDGRPRWRVALTGGFVTAVLFTIGKALLRWLLTQGNLGNLYGASASIVLVLLFVFYASLIMYFGAAFTRLWADHLGVPITTTRTATRYRLTSVKDNGEKENA